MMADLIFARRVNDLSREMPFYVNMLRALDHQINHAKPPLYGSIYVMNVCNLHCIYRYWWLDRKIMNTAT
jgi:hypothetical protein